MKRPQVSPTNWAQLLAGLLLLVFLDARGQTWEVFNTANVGLPSDAITDIAEDGQQRLWVGTEWGLSMYDGSAWTHFQTTNSGLPDDRVTAVAVDTLGRVWVGTVLAGLAIYDEGAGWSYFNTSNSPLPDDQIKSLTVDHRGWIWIGTFLGVMCYTGDEWRLYNDQPESYGGLVMNGSVIEDVAVREDGLVAIGTLNGGFHYMTGSVIQAHATYIDEFFDNTQMGVVFDPVNDQRWVATPSQGLLRNFGDWQGGFWFQYATFTSNMPVNSLSCVAVDAWGRPWVGSVTAGLIMRDDDDTFQQYTTANSGLPVNGITDLFFSADGTLWIATEGGGLVRMIVSTGVTQPAEEELSVYPNPTNDVCYIEANDVLAAGSPWILRDLNGRVVASGRLSPGQRSLLDLSDYARGIYILECNGPHANVFARILRS